VVTVSGRTKVLDFGIARAVRRSAARFDTRDLNALTPAYATEEMLQGAEPIESDDVFGLACVAYELLTGRHPFKGLDVRAAQQQKLLPQPVASLSSAQNRVLRRALAFAQKDRYQSIDAFIEALTTPSSGAVRSWTWIAVAGCVAAGFAATWWWATQRERPRQPVIATSPSASTFSSASTSVASRAVGQTFRDCPGNCPGMVVVPTGVFIMGSPPSEAGRSSDERTRSVTVPSPFAISVYPISLREFRAFVAATGRRPDAPCVDATSISKVHAVDFANPGFMQHDDEPVVCVSANDARAYAAWINQISHQKGYRLLSEAEWEYAARAGATTAFPWGSAEGDACAQGNFGDRSYLRGLGASKNLTAICDDGYEFTSPVHTFARSRWGLGDMIGNVLVWTEGCPHPGNDPLTTATFLANCQPYRVLRGSSFATLVGRSYLRVARRTVPPPSMQATNQWGFRIARSF
jgi:formylglycine-generating enzyme required for sulfatase activity